MGGVKGGRGGASGRLNYLYAFRYIYNGNL